MENKQVWTARGRRFRLNALLNEIKGHEFVLIQDLHKFGLKTLGVSRRTLDMYIEELHDMGFIEGDIYSRDASIRITSEGRKALEEAAVE